VTALLAAPALTDAARACRERSCEARLSVDPRGTLYRSAEWFRPAREAVTVRLFAAGRELQTVDRDRSGRCRRHLRAPGIAARVSVCGESTPVKVWAERTWGGSVEMRILYRSRPLPAQGVKGASTGSGSGGGIGAPSPGGVNSP
jgi:hypothetical protein